MENVNLFKMWKVSLTTVNQSLETDRNIQKAICELSCAARYSILPHWKWKAFSGSAGRYFKYLQIAYNPKRKIPKPSRKCKLNM